MNDGTTPPALGVIFHPKFPPETLAEFSRKAEGAGFDELWLWDDCFTPGALTAAAIALSATSRLKVGIGLIPATVINPLFAAMEITTLARAFPGRILPGFGHGFGPWMTQIGATPKSFLQTTAATVSVVRQILSGELVTVHADGLNLEKVQLAVPPGIVPPLYIGAMREKSLRMAGRVGDGTILTAMSSPDYVRWSIGHIRAGMAEVGRTDHRVVAYLDVKVNPDGAAARAAERQTLVKRLPWTDSQAKQAGIGPEGDAFIQAHTAKDLAQQMPDAWVDAFSASGTPDQVLAALPHWLTSGADSIVFQPLEGDPDCLDEYIQYLMPRLRPRE